jgi:hypothetical protein
MENGQKKSVAFVTFSKICKRMVTLHKYNKSGLYKLESENYTGQSRCVCEVGIG